MSEKAIDAVKGHTTLYKRDEKPFPIIFEVDKGYFRSTGYKTEDGKVFWTMGVSNKKVEVPCSGYKPVDSEIEFDLLGFVVHDAGMADILSHQFKVIADHFRKEEAKEDKMIKVKLDEGAFKPERAHTYDAGMDLRSPRALQIPANGSGVIDTGVHIEIPKGFAGFLKSKSGLNVKHDITSEGVIDCEYTGSIVVKLYNHGTTSYKVERGDKITQLVILPVDLSDVTVVDEIAQNDNRGDGGFGSTGR